MLVVNFECELVWPIISGKSYVVETGKSIKAMGLLMAEQRLVTTDIDFRSFKPTVEILITYYCGSQIFPAVSRWGVWLQMEVVCSSVYESRSGFAEDGHPS